MLCSTDILSTKNLIASNRNKGMTHALFWPEPGLDSPKVTLGTIIWGRCGMFYGVNSLA